MASQHKLLNITKQEYIELILHRLEEKYPIVKTPLKHKAAYELLFATILSAQCTDERVNKVTPDLFRRFQKLEDYATADVSEIREYIKSINFLNNKSKNIKNSAKMILDEFDGEVPDKMEDLIKLPGVARKTANVVLSEWFDEDQGIVIDTHVIRLTNRYGLVNSKDPIKIEKKLMKIIPEEQWRPFSLRLVFYGREVCNARGHECRCCLLDLY